MPGWCAERHADNLLKVHFFNWNVKRSNVAPIIASTLSTSLHSSTSSKSQEETSSLPSTTMPSDPKNVILNVEQLSSTIDLNRSINPQQAVSVSTSLQSSEETSSLTTTTPSDPKNVNVTQSDPKNDNILSISRKALGFVRICTLDYLKFIAKYDPNFKVPFLTNILPTKSIHPRYKVNPVVDSRYELCKHKSGPASHHGAEKKRQKITNITHVPLQLQNTDPEGAKIAFKDEEIACLLSLASDKSNKDHRGHIKWDAILKLFKEAFIEKQDVTKHQLKTCYNYRKNKSIYMTSSSHVSVSTTECPVNVVRSGYSSSYTATTAMTTINNNNIGVRTVNSSDSSSNSSSTSNTEYANQQDSRLAFTTTEINNQSLDAAPPRTSFTPLENEILQSILNDPQKCKATMNSTTCSWSTVEKSFIWECKRQKLENPKVEVYKRSSEQLRERNKQISGNSSSHVPKAANKITNFLQ